jgi:muramoyltetrapeptide carboxypeptidase
MRKPRPLRPGDRIAIVAPASPFARDEFDRGVAELKRLGFDPTWDDSVFANESGYLAGSGELRAESFLKHWNDASVSALIAVRGGYGSVHMLPYLHPPMLVAAPKLFIGYSDNTSLLSWLNCGCGITALHGPMLERRLSSGAAGYDEHSFVALTGNGTGVELAP